MKEKIEMANQYEAIILINGQYILLSMAIYSGYGSKYKLAIRNENISNVSLQ